MYTLNAQYRDRSAKAKQLRRKGLIPSCIYGTSLEESVLIQVPQPDISRFLKANARGSVLTIDLGDKKYNVLLKEISNDLLGGRVEHIDFQHLTADAAINTVVQVSLINREKNPNLVQLQLEEIPYNALPSDLAERIVIDVDGMEAGTLIRIADLDIAKDEKIRLLTDAETVVVSVMEKTRATAEDEDEADAAEGEAEAGEA
ncbi:MAG: 50S ribosomal protein L25 [Christensenellales bacterium]|jgi:large subunit ribosomal protein L25